MTVRKIDYMSDSVEMCAERISLHINVLVDLKIAATHIKDSYSGTVPAEMVRRQVTKEKQLSNAIKWELVQLINYAQEEGK